MPPMLFRHSNRGHGPLSTNSIGGMAPSLQNRAVNLRILATILLLPLFLPGCQSPGAGQGEAGTVVFVDAAGNRMVLDVPVPAARGDGAMPATSSAPATSPGEGATSPTPDSPPTQTVFGGEQFTDVDAFEQSVEQRNRERFYTIPRADGGVGVVTASELGMGDSGIASAGVPAAPARQVSARLLACPGGVSLGHLLARGGAQRREELAFPVLGESLQESRRYAGYRLPLPVGTVRLRVQALGRRGPPPDVVVALLDGAGHVMSVVYNIATESIPETLFAYARVSTEIAVPPVLGRDAGVVVVEGEWARKSLPAACRPGQPSGSAVGGHVTLEFLQAK